MEFYTDTFLTRMNELYSSRGEELPNIYKYTDDYDEPYVRTKKKPKKSNKILGIFSRRKTMIKKNVTIDDIRNSLNETDTEISPLFRVESL